MEKEKRLIDAVELTDRVFAITMCVTGMRNGKTFVKEILEKYRNEVLRTICEAPTVDAVEVVRCKDCEHSYKSSGSSTGYKCECWGVYDIDCECNPDGHCYNGRKEMR